jgi:acyl carrier protein
MTLSDLVVALKAFFNTIVPDSGGGRTLDANTDLFETGYLDSLTTFEMALFLEEQFAVTLPLNRMSPKELSSVANLYNSLVARQLV